MMRWIRSLLAGVALLAALGCTGNEEPAENQEAVFDPLLETMDRARSVEGTVQDQADELRRRIEEAEGERE